MATITRSVSQSFTPTESLSITISIWGYVNSHSDTLSLTDSGLSRSVSDYVFARTLSDSFSNSESLSRSVITFLTTKTLSDSFSNTESLSRAVDTWKHVLSYNMTLTTSESLSKTTSTYRQDVTLQDSLTPSESLATSVDTWFHTISPSDTLTNAESLSVSISLWFHIHTLSDSITLSDGLTIQTSIADDTYFYDTYNMSDVDRLVGHISSGNFTSDTSRVSNINAMSDGAVNINTIYNGSSNSIGCVVFDFGSQVVVDFAAIHVKSTLSQPVKIYGSNSQGSGYTVINTLFGSDGAWQISDTNEFTYRYYAVQIEGMSSDVEVGEVLIGKSFKPEIRFSLGANESYKAKNTINESFTGSEYAYQLMDLKNAFTRQYPNISATLKSEFDTLWDKSNNRKMLYYYDSTIHYVLSDEIKFTEIAHNRFSTSYQLSS